VTNFVKSLIFLLLFTTSAYAVDVQLGFGSLTPHFSSSKKNYCNQWNNTGIIVNKTYYLRVVGEKFGMSYLVGNDSICSEIEGLLIHYMLERYEYVDVGISFGGYAYNANNWTEHAKKTPSGIDAPEPLHTKIGDKDVVPVLALDVGIHLIKSDVWSLKLNNLLTPVIFNHSIAFEYRF
jgi:hypothetical protein